MLMRFFQAAKYFRLPKQYATGSLKIEWRLYRIKVRLLRALTIFSKQK
ncbi:hypothetical protein ACKLNO_07520 [Neisseriaceae bacterium B1]